MIWAILACDGIGGGTGGGSSATLIVDYDGLSDGSAWVYRDDGDTGLPDEEQLLRTQYTGDGVVEFRRGTRWADAASVGTLVWDTRYGLGLSSWSLLGGGSGDVLITDFDPVEGEVISGEDWSCTVTRPVEGEPTWYGLFEDVVVSECAGSGPEGRYVFAREVGLIRLTLPDGSGLNLVAPW